MEPKTRPRSPLFSSGPCAKRPGWSPQVLDGAVLGRSHRSKPGKARLKRAIEETREMLGVPADYRIAIVAGSDTGAVEMALWSLLGPRGVDVLAWESFGKGWATDILDQLRLADVRVLEADYGALPDLAAVDCDRDVVFTWNGTTSGVAVPDGEWIADDRAGLTICDATSAAFAVDLPWDKLDVVTFSWQKVMGGEAAHGMAVLGPRAAERLVTHRPSWPMPKLFRLTKGKGLNEAIFEGSTINTPSMLCVEDYLDALAWAREIGGLDALIARSRRNQEVVSDWVAGRAWVDFLAAAPATRSSTSICLRIADPWFDGRPVEEQARLVKRLTGILEARAIAHDIGSYRDAPPGLRLWGGATVDSEDLAALLPWLDWAFARVKAEAQ